MATQKTRRNPDDGVPPMVSTTPDDKSDAAALKRRGPGRKSGDLTYNDLMDEMERLERKVSRG